MNKLFPILALVLLLPISTMAECTCESKEEVQDKTEAFKYKLIAIASIITASAIGVCLPLLGNLFPILHPENDIFFLIKAFAAGVILATGCMHVLPDAFENLTSPCLSERPWRKFPFTGFVAMLSAIGTMVVDTFAMSYYKRSHLDKAKPWFGDEVLHGHHEDQILGSSTELEPSEDLVRHRIISQVLEMGIVVHSVIIGISMGTSTSPATIKPLVVALTFHQLFEGMGLGSCISEAKFRMRTVAAMSIFFSLTTPFGIAIGFGLSNIYNENSQTALVVEGIFNAASAGILIYMALVDLLAADFTSPRLQANLKLQLGAYVSLLLGSGFMSLLANWA